MFTLCLCENNISHFSILRQRNAKRRQNDVNGTKTNDKRVRMNTEMYTIIFFPYGLKSSFSFFSFLHKVRSFFAICRIIFSIDRFKP